MLTIPAENNTNGYQQMLQLKKESAMGVYVQAYVLDSRPRLNTRFVETNIAGLHVQHLFAA